MPDREQENKVVPDTMRTVVVSACLLGHNCRYDGGNNLNEKVLKAVEGCNVVPVCPEMLGGLPCPRIPCEIVDGKVCSRDGRNLDRQFREGAEKALEIARESGAEVAILQSRSPSCGVNQVYDGTFSGRLVPGQGVFAELLSENGIRVVDASDPGAV